MNRYGKNTLYGYLWRLILRTQNVADIEFLRPAYPDSITLAQIQAEFEQFLNELKHFTELRHSLDIYRQFIQPDYDTFILGQNQWLPLLYALIRIKKPEIVIETGCATGTTASLILYALQQNQKGHLYSIDVRFPTDWISTNNLSSGFLIPETLKSRWTFIPREIKAALPELLAQLGHVDFFYHDSDHSYVHQMWEYLTAWPYIPIGGILASDDLYHNTAFFDFIRQVPEKLNITSRGRNFGMVAREYLLDIDYASIGNRF